MQSEAYACLSDGVPFLASVTYRSKAVVPLSDHELLSLTKEAQRRNRSVGVTGMLLYDKGRYFQTIEGPPEGIDQIWASILRDERHGGIEVLNQQIAPRRLFSDWDMRLWSRDSRRPIEHSPRSPRLRELTDAVATVVKLALDVEDGGLTAFIEGLVAKSWDADSLISNLFEPVARQLGDAWMADYCTDVELSIALARLQVAGHVLHAAASRDRLQLYVSKKILVVPAPAEPHMLGTSLLGDLFINAGWTVDIAFPESAEALARQLSALCPDAVDIGLSDAMVRETALPELGKTIGICRKAVTARDLVVSVGGRAFVDSVATAASVGADHARMSAVGTVAALTRLVQNKLQ